MDIATILGLLVGVFFVALGIATGPDGLASFGNFYDLVSIFITFGGSVSAMITSYTIPSLVNGLKGFVLAVKGVKFDEAQIIKDIINLSNVARKEGLLALEEAANNMEDEFIKKGILLIVDGTDPELVRGIMETELACTEERHAEVIGFWDNLGTMGPAWGMIGTLIGLINMLKKLDDISSVGPNMAVALLTTLYGSLLANWLCIPVSAKLKANNAVEVKMRQVMIEGILSIQAGENPRVIEEKLKSFLSPKQRQSFAEEGQGGE
ncbi:MAG: motility protein A [Lachnospiraceae bacterium]|nr:motility protein A [Lachnospiraceae bacterium]